ncbi:MAG: GAF domain-containing protein [Chloroflexi bacterium]|nr:GAF domain-containing protein [Chloroflexota bacterium]
MSANEKHSLLKRQIKRHIGNLDSLPEDWEGFIHAIDDAYYQFDHDRKMLERSLELTSQELLATNSAIRAVYERLIESSVDGIFAFDRDFRFTVWNPEMERLSGISRLAALGKSCRAVFPALDASPEDQYFADALAGKTILAPEISFIACESLRALEGSFSPLLSETQEIIGGLAIVRDVTARKVAEEETRRRLAQLEAVNRLSTRLRETLTVDAMLPIIADESAQFLNANSVSIWLYDPIQDELHQVFQRGFPPIQTGIKRTQGISGHVITTGEIYISRDFKNDPLTLDAARAQVPEGLSGVCVPVRAAHQIIGTLFLSVQQPREISARETGPLLILAEIAGNIHRARLNSQTEQRLERLTVLRNIDTAISSSLDLNVTLNVLLDQITGALGFDAADVLLLNPHTHILEMAAGRGFRGASLAHTRLRLGQGLAGRAALDRRVLHVRDLRDRKNEITRQALLTDEACVTYYAAPLFVKGQVKGVLEIFRRSVFEPDIEWNDFLETLARQAAIAIDNTELFNNLQRSNLELGMAYDTTLEGWSKALDLRDKETEGHTQRVTELTLRLARAMDVNAHDLVQIRRGAILHDIGKMGIPDSILLKPGSLTEAEWNIMRMHPQYAFDMLSPIAYLRPALDIPYAHHEKWDGTGYPRGLKGEEIPFAARMFAAADIWDALRSDRPYRASWQPDKIREHLRALAGSHLDARVVEQFLKLDLESDEMR